MTKYTQKYQRSNFGLIRAKIKKIVNEVLLVKKPFEMKKKNRKIQKLYFCDRKQKND